MQQIEDFLITINHWVWSAPLLLLLAGTGVYLTFRLRGLQFTHLGYALSLVFRPHEKSREAEGSISHFEALTTALAATIGVGTVAGVGTALALGGLGAIFWMLVVGLFGMATKYAEAILAVEYRVVEEEQNVSGGPMYYLERGLKQKNLAIAFSFFGLLATAGFGNLVQAQSVADAVMDIVDINPWVIGLALAAMTGAVIVGGIESIGKVTSYLVPLMALVYIFSGLGVLFAYYERIPQACLAILHTAFQGQAAIGGFVGSTLMMAIQEGVSKGIFSNESGLGSSGIAAAAAKTDHSGRQAIVAMTSAFFTLIITTLTGLVIAVSGVLGTTGPTGRLLMGAPLTMAAFTQAFPFARLVLTIGLILFAYSTILGWAYYGEKCAEYLWGKRIIPYLRVLVVLILIPGATMTVQEVWSLAGIMNGLMALPNLIGLLGLTGVVVARTRSFLRLLQSERQGFS